MFGDIITYEEDDNYFVTHRIISKDGNSLITKGDRNNELDNEISSSKIIGKVIFHSLFWGNFVVKYLKYVFIGFTVFIIFINLYIYIKKTRKRDGEDERREKEKNKNEIDK